MGASFPTSREYEAEANRLRARIGADADELLDRLTPRNIAAEAATRAGISDLSWSSAFGYASKRHPIPSAVIGIGLALLTLSAARKRTGADNVVALTAPIRDSSRSIVDAATKVFRERAEAKRRELVGVAQTQVAAAAALVSDEIEKRLEDFVEQPRGRTFAQPLIQASLQVLVLAALEGLLKSRARP